ncbi:MAG: hypothetical protein Q4A05_10765 [Ruminococcus sp.]|nr:hypothetical protein [Ruminococcus sp.]
MKVTVKIDNVAIKRISDAAKAAAVDTMEQLYADLVKSKTMPFDIGDMQNNNTWVEQTENGAVLITGSPQARRLYYHPELMVDSQTGAGPFPIKDKKGNVKGFRYRKGAHLVPDPKGRMLNFQKGKNANAGTHWLEPYISGDKKDFIRDKYIELFRRRAGL